MTTTATVNGVTITAPLNSQQKQILSPDSQRFLRSLSRKFNKNRLDLLDHRNQLQADIDAGQLPDFLEETQTIRESDWQVAPIPQDLKDRRVEITGPVDRKMVINALNSGANTYMADFEDSHSPTWEGTLQGQINLQDAVSGDITHVSPEGKTYRLKDSPAVLIVRPRGWHLNEKHFLVDGLPISASLFDFGLYLFHNAQALMAKNTGPYFYLPKLENHLEARLWNDVFCFAQERLDIPQGTIKATVLIETILAAFEAEEILYELKEHAAGLNCGRWDYIFSFIKKFKNVPGYIFPDRDQITMTRHCMRSYSLLVIQICHRRNAHAMGGMAAQIPIKEDAEKNRAALKKVRADKVREATDGHDGTWVAHPGLIELAMEEFNQAMPTPNQIDRLRDDIDIQAADLLKCPAGTITEKGLRNNIDVGVRYLAAWLGGNGCVPIYNLMEDAATAEISRSQVWQWVHHPEGILEDGRKVTLAMVRQVLAEELEKIRMSMGETAFSQGHFEEAAALFEDIIADSEMDDFLTLRAYEKLS